MIFEKLTGIIAEQIGCGAGEIKPETTFEELGVDSLDTVEMVMRLEEELGIEVELEGSLKTVGELARFVEARMGSYD
ncbi:MAG TPA: acyl carrier protein [Oscillospiraceae bacterium]|nr:acyl carrier protein [Oscillospiraceae bacterium]